MNEEICFFPDMKDPDPVYHFTGVTFGTMVDEVIVSEDQCNTFLKEACDRYLEDNPEDSGLVTHALGESHERE